MTSKRLFLRGMREDLRHKVWMLTLSLLGSFLALPVTYLLRYSDVELSNIRMNISMMAPEESANATAQSVNSMADFFKQELMLTAGIVAVLGALIVGVECFYYLQQKSTVDTYHSLPVSRIQLFGMKYINGILIWLVPYLFCMILTLIFSGIMLARVGALSKMPILIREAGINTAILILVFLLVYHLILFSTMLTGNVLNTLIIAAVLGCGAIAAYGTVLGFMATYLETYRPSGAGGYVAISGSPLVMSMFLIYCRVEDEFLTPGFPVSAILLCIAMALAMGALALFFYVRRPSERAGRGLDIKGIAGILRLFVSILAGMGGWLFMYSLTDSVAWSIFGALLVGGLTYGVLDVVFSMDFKAFFRHKWSMAGTLALVLLISLGFQEDWMGYDSYLPVQERIQKISIACPSYSNNMGTNQILAGVELTDTAQIYAFLERGIENVYGRTTHKPKEQMIADIYQGERYRRDTFNVRVTLLSGRSYYRVYPYYEWDEDVVAPLLCSEEYARAAYYLSEDTVDACVSMRFSGGPDDDGERRNMETKDEGIIRQVAESYNRDLLESPGTIIRGQGRSLGQIIMRSQGMNRTVILDIFEGMEQTLETLENCGIQIFDLPWEAEKVESITFNVNGNQYWYKGEDHISPVERSIRGWFGVYPDSLYAAEENVSHAVSETDESPEDYSFTITDPEMIEEVLDLIQYASMHGAGTLIRDFVPDVTVRDSDGAEWSVYLRRGDLPEEYVQEFIREAETEQ